MRSPGSWESGNTESDPSRKWILRARAKKQVKVILAYLELQRLTAADAFGLRLVEALDLLAGMPLMGRMARSTRMLRKGYRCFVVDDYNVYYKATDRGVEVYDVIHAVRATDSPAKADDNAAPA